MTQTTGKSTPLQAFLLSKMMCFLYYLNWVELVLSTYSVNHPKTIIDFQKELRQRNSIIIFSFNKYSRAFCPLGEPARWAVIGVQERKFFISTKEMCVLSTSLLCWAAHWCCHYMVHTASSASALAASATLPPSSLSPDVWAQSRGARDSDGVTQPTSFSLAEQSPVTS